MVKIGVCCRDMAYEGRKYMAHQKIGGKIFSDLIHEVSLNKDQVIIAIVDIFPSNEYMSNLGNQIAKIFGEITK